MKKKLLFIVLVAGAALLTACQESSEMSSKVKVSLHATYLHPEQVDLQLHDAEGGTLVFTIQSQDTPWTILEVPDWMTVNPMSGNSTTTVSVTLTKNELASSRVGIFTLSSATEEWAYQKKITVSQDGAKPYLKMDDLAFSFDGAAHQEKVSAISNFDWEVSFENGGPIWLTVTSNGKEMTLNVTPNDTQEARYETVLIKYKGTLMGSFTVAQAPAEITYVADELHYGISGGSYHLSITSEAPWTVGTDNTITGQSWVDISPSKGGEGTTEVTITVPPNPGTNERACTIYIRFSSSQREIAALSLSQDGAVLDLDLDHLRNLSAMGGADHMLLTSNIDWVVTEVPEFLTISPMSGSGTTDLSFSIAENSTYDEKYGQVAIRGTEYEFGVSMEARQRSRRPDFTTGTWLTCNDSPQTLTVDVDTDGPWGVVYERSFFDVTPTAASGKQTINFMVDENKGDWRQGAANFRPYGVQGHDDNSESEWWIYVNQDGWRDKYHEIPEVIDLAMGTSGQTYPMDIDIATTDAWSAQILDNPDWIRVTGTSSGKGSGKLQISYDGNPLTQVRSARVQISFSYLDAIILTLRQEGRHLISSASHVFFFGGGGRVPLVVTPSDEFSISIESGDWFSLERLEDNSYLVVAEPMTDGEERSGGIILTLNGVPASTYQLKVPVIQMNAATFTRSGFTEDRDLNIITSPGLSIKVTSYTEDRNWDGNRQAQIGGEGYDDDENWN